jgi:hypothetical protein
VKRERRLVCGNSLTFDPEFPPARRFDRMNNFKGPRPLSRHVIGTNHRTSMAGNWRLGV